MVGKQSKLRSDSKSPRPSIQQVVLLVILVSFAAKLALGYLIRDSFFSRGNSFGPLNAIARNIVRNFEYAQQPGIPSVDYEPLYPAILAASYRLFGENWFGVTFIQGVLFGATSYLLFLIGRRVRDEVTGLVAALYHSFYPYLFCQTLSVVDTTQFIFIIVLLLQVVLSDCPRSHIVRYYGSTGSLIGLSLLSRGSAIAMLPPIIVYALFKGRGKVMLKGLAIMVGATAIVLAPWLTRNYRYAKMPIISTHGPFGLWQGNNEFSYEYLRNNISLDSIYALNPPPRIYQENPLKPRPPKEAVKVAEKYKAAAFRFMRENPKEFIKLCWIKCVKFWSWTYNGYSPSKSSYGFGDHKIRKYVYFLSYVPLLILFLPGFWLLSRQSQSHFMLFSCTILTYTVAHMIVIGYTRLRLPLDPLLMILLGIVISRAYSQAKTAEPVQ